MLNVLYKEIKLAVSPIVYLMGFLSLLILIPNYPAWVGVFYCFISVNVSFNIARANKDLEFSVMLPIPRKHVVLGKCFNVIYSEMIQLAFAIPSAIVATQVLYPVFAQNGLGLGNSAGMDANLAFFGMLLIAFTAFNLVFLPTYFKSGYKSGLPLIFGMLAFSAIAGLCEVVVNLVPALKSVIDGTDKAYIGYRSIVLVMGIIIYVFGNYGIYKLSVKTFEKVSL